MSNSKASEIEALIHKLELLPHPEGGFYRETYRSVATTNGGTKNLLTCIYFLLTSENVSRFHRIKSDEHWFYHEGSPLIVHFLDHEGHHQQVVGPVSQGYIPQFMVPAHTVFGSTVLEEDNYSLVSCAVAPGFDFEDFEMIKRTDLLQSFPAQADIISRLGID